MAEKIAGTTITAARTADPQAAPERSTLHVVFPPELRRAFRLREAETAVGRDPGLDGLVLDHGTISRRHAALVWDGARRAHALRDLGSRNGSAADGVSAAGEARPLVDGSILRLGDTLLVYEQEPAGGVPGDDGAEVARDAVPGQSARMRRLRAQIARAARDPAPALIIGETGTGKERIARELHRLSGRTGKLVALNCAALSAQIVESQLFGHVKGAFTGAADAQPGLFRAAHGGTIFLDEIGDLPTELQPKLLRVLQEGEVLPVGATQPARVDVRVIAATHRDLARAVADGKFREDLYARLSIAELHVPALRERRVDLLEWIARLHADWAARRDAGDGGGLRFDADAAEALLRFAWPLNLRGLERLVHDLGTGVAAGGGGGGGVASASATIGKGVLPSWLGTRPAGGAEPGAGGGAGTVDATAVGAQGRDPVPTREEFTRVFEEVAGSVHALARRFARDRRQIYRWIEAYGLAEKRPRAPGGRER